MSADILRKCEDLVEINPLTIDEILLPKIRSYLGTKSGDNWLPEGHYLPFYSEFGLNLFFNVVNFCYKDPASGCEYLYLDKAGGRLKRSTGLLAAMARSGIDWASLDSIQAVSPQLWREMLQISDKNPMFLPDERRNKIVGFASHLLSLGYEGVSELLVDSDYSASKVIQILSRSGYFEDKFLKRAQLACRMISDVLVRNGHEPLCDLDQLTVMADYRIPQVFYNLGVVDIVHNDLVDRLYKEQPLLSNSREEEALRATAVVVGKMVANKLGIL